MSELALKLIREAKEKRLPYLDLAFCGLTELPDELFELEWLEQLNLAGQYINNNSNEGIRWKESLNKGPSNNIVNLISIKRLKSLKNLSIGGSFYNNSDLWDISSLEDITTLHILCISFCKVKNLYPLSNLVELEILTLSSNEIDNIKPLENLHNLLILYLNNNKHLYDINAIRNMKELWLLNLSYTSIGDISPLQACNQLTYLDISSTKVTDVSPLANLLQLKELNISNSKANNLNSISEQVRLERLKGSIITSENLDFLKNQRQLKELHIKNEQSLDFVKRLPVLEELNITRSFNLISLIPLEGCPSIVSLIITWSHLNDLSPLTKLSNLSRLILMLNTGTVDFNEIGKFKNLKTLQVEEMGVDDLSFISELRLLESLAISHANATDISAIIYCKNLRWLDISGTNISSIESLSRLDHLEQIVLDGTSIISIAPLIKFIKNGLPVYADGYHPEFSADGIYVKIAHWKYHPMRSFKMATTQLFAILKK
ncbi:MAG: hypothetical protein IPK76_13030 [Lewinellaceae bacterium]|nr:hypothetical protein [Lewinellaceae bacterium]